jgi:hypothetical protein
MDANWGEQNQRYLIQSIEEVKASLYQQVDATRVPPVQILTSSGKGSALDTLCQQFNLTAFDRSILLLCAGIELDASVAQLCGTIDPQHPYATFSLALGSFENPTWNSLTPEAPLRRWHLIEIGPGNALTTSPLRIDERILHHLTGVQDLDQRLTGLVEAVEPKVPFLVESHQALSDRLSQIWINAADQERPVADFPILQILGSDTASKRAVIQSMCHGLGLELYRISAESIAKDPDQFNLLIRLCEREYRLANRIFWMDCDFLEQSDGMRESAIARLLEQLKCPLILTRSDRQRQRDRQIITVEVTAPTPREQRMVWEAALETIDTAIPAEEISSLVDHFNLSSSSIQSAIFQASSIDVTQASMKETLWGICRQQARPRLDELAHRIAAYGHWDDLVLPEKEHLVLREITAHVKQRARVYETWGFEQKNPRGLGISALFSGASGTGKTTAAEAIAQVLNLDIYRVDLSAIVSKYIGETEKNLRRIFDAAEGGGVILLFDEADSLFGKRSEVKDSHDRNANLEVSYLLQRMETYRGLAILTTNLKSSIDQAFMRRIRFIVQFPFPDAVQRAEIWRRCFPTQTPTKDLDFDKLGKLSIAGGNIRNIALNAAFIAADAEEAVQMKHVLRSAKSEYVKLERPLTETEVKGWV